MCMRCHSQLVGTRAPIEHQQLLGSAEPALWVVNRQIGQGAILGLWDPMPRHHAIHRVPPVTDRTDLHRVPALQKFVQITCPPRAISRNDVLRWGGFSAHWRFNQASACLADRNPACLTNNAHNLCSTTTRPRIFGRVPPITGPLSTC